MKWLPKMLQSLPGIVATVCVTVSHLSASDWPAYRNDARRSAVSVDRLEFPLQTVWHRTSKLAPRPAFEDPVKHPASIDFTYVRDGAEPVLLDFDHAFHPVAASGRVYFGSSADDSVRCLSLTTGEQRWVFVTGGPVRFAPHVVDDRVYVASDDGVVYCLAAATGKVHWKFQAAPSNRQLAGNGRMISRWPLRSGVLVLDGTVYVTAGMWPAEGVFVYALDAHTGQPQWINDTSGTLNLPTANRGAYAISGVAPTGYLLASDDALVVPTGRSIPASYSRKDGRLLASVAPSYQNRRGGPAVCIDRHGSVIFGYPRERLTARAYSVHYAYQLPNMTQFGTMRGDRVLTADRTFVAVNDLIRCYDANSRYTKVKVEWEQPCPSRPLRSMALCENALLMGVDDRVIARDRKTGALLWEQDDLDGYVQSLAVADDRLLVATDSGSVYCFAADGTSPEGVHQRSTPLLNPAATAPVSTVLEPLIARTVPRRGLALVVGELDPGLASALAATTQLQVVQLLRDSEDVRQARHELLDSNTPNSGQVSVYHHVAAEPLPFADFAFNLIVASAEEVARRADDLYRVLRPSGGLICIRQGDAAAEALIRKAAEHDVPATGSHETTESLKRSLTSTVSVAGRDDESVLLRRGKLPGALDWDSANSRDMRVKWPLELLWFGAPGSKRTGGGSRPPISAGGRNYVIGKNHLIALDAYNGTELWARTLPYCYRNVGRLRNAPGPIRPWLADSVNADDQHVWLNFGHVVYTLDAETGEQSAVHGEIPGAPVFLLTDSGVQFVLDHYRQPGPRGVTSASTKSLVPAGTIDLRVDDNRQLRVLLELHDDIVIDDRVYWELFFDFRPADQQADLFESGVFQLLVRPESGQVERGIGAVHPDVDVSVSERNRRVSLAISMDGLEVPHGRNLDEFSFAAALNHPTGPDQSTMAGGRGYLRWEYHADHFATAFNNGWPRIRLTGPETVGSEQASITLPPISELPEQALKSGCIGGVGQRAGYVVNLKGERENPLSGEISDFEFNRGKGCGTVVSSESLQVLRSGTLAFYDVNDDSGMRYFGGVRPACTVSAIASQGLVFAAEGSSGCSCNYNFKTTVALAPANRRRNEDWAMFTAPLSPGAQLRTGRFNLGAPGDRRDDQGDLWLQYPRAPTYSSRLLPGSARTMPVPVELSGSELSAYRVNSDRVGITNTERPWLFASGYEGLERVRLQLFMSDKEGIVVFPGDAPQLDAVLESSAWEKQYGVPAGTGSSLFLSHDRNALYVGYEVVPPLDRRGKRLTWTIREGGVLPYSNSFGFDETSRDEAVWEENSLEFLISDGSLQSILHLGVGISGGRYDAVWRAAQKKEDASATIRWSGALDVTGDKAIAEFAIPWQTLLDVGLDIENLFIRPRTRQPLTRQPHIAHAFRPIIIQQDRSEAERYQVTLYFAELSDAAAGERVFDVELQGKTVLSGFDPVAVSGGRNRAVVRTFSSVAADRVLVVRFRNTGAEKLRPILSAIEVVRE